MITLSNIHPFPARMAPSIVEDILRQKKSSLVVLDPMAGSGTTLATAAMLGHKAIGFDTDPLAVLLSSTLALPFDVTAVTSAARRVLARSEELCKTLRASSAYPAGLDPDEKRFVRYWFCATSRKQLYSLSEKISRLRNPHVQRILWVAFSRMIIRKNNGVSLAMDVSHSRPHRVYDRAPVTPFDCFVPSVNRVLRGMEAVGLTDPEVIRAALGDARHLRIQDESVDLVVTSPPYVNAIDYIRGHKLSLVWMGHKLADLRKLRSTNVGAEAGLCCADPGDAISAAIRALGSTSRIPPRQTRILSKFVSDLDLVVREIFRVLVPHGEAFFVIGDSNLRGTFIRNSAALASLARSCGFDVFTVSRRDIPDNRRYLPPPSAMAQASLGLRMRQEVVIGVKKPAT